MIYFEDWGDFEATFVVNSASMYKSYCRLLVLGGLVDTGLCPSAPLLWIRSFITVWRLHSEGRRLTIVQTMLTVVL